MRIRVAHAEARRAGGVQELVELAASSDVHARELALRGLGRTGGAQARAVLEQAVTDKDPRVVAAALSAIGVAAALDEDPAWTPGIANALTVAPLPAIEALGRAGDASSQAELAVRVASSDPAVASAAAIALGRHGRRKIAWQPEARAALASATRSLDAGVRYAATYALSREHEPPADDAVHAALFARVADDNPETRASAIAGLARRKVLATVRRQLEHSLRDHDWRVAVEAVRALAGANGDDAGRTAVANALSTWFAELANGNAGDAHVILEALRAFTDHPPANTAPLVELARVAAADQALPALTKGWIECLAVFDFDHVMTCKLPDHLRLPLLADLAKSGDANVKRGAIRTLLAHEDPRVRAAGLGVLPETWTDADAKGQATIVGTVSSALAVRDPIVAGTAVDVAGTLYEAMGPDHALRTTLDAAILARAKTEHDVELAASLYALIGKRAIAGGADICRAGLGGQPARAKAAAECLTALGEATPPPPAAAAEPPPGDVASVIGKQLRWHLATTRGEVVIELRPDVAPWAVASIVALTKRGFYDGLEFHRVVPNFVVQGGDPTMSGWGGPGYTLPAEPASALDAPGYVAGGVGIADAGKDSGGSQWFIMHSRAPHLDGRYTWIGTVVAGQKSANALLIGDRVERATIEAK